MENGDKERFSNGADGPDARKFNDTLIRMFKTPPDPNRTAQTRDPDQKLKPGGTPAKKHRPEEDS